LALRPHQRSERDLLYAAITKSGGVLFHSIARSIDWRVVWRFASGSIPITGLTLLVMSQMAPQAMPAAI
jgi:hypothetical protein